MPSLPSTVTLDIFPDHQHGVSYDSPMPALNVHLRAVPQPPLAWHNRIQRSREHTRQRLWFTAFCPVTVRR